ncbi:MAG: response regulator [Myxococcales bacterium]|nr:response regulator [Myxococcales bacterium]
MSSRGTRGGARSAGVDDRGVDPALALASVAALLGRGVDSEARVLEAGVRALEALGLRGGLALLEPDGATLCFREVAWPSTFLRAVERLVGLRARGYRFDVRSSETYRRVVGSGETLYVEDTASVLAPTAVHRVLRGALAGESSELAVAQVVEWLVGADGWARGAAWSSWGEGGGPVELDARGFGAPALAALREGCALRKGTAVPADADVTPGPCPDAVACCAHPGAVSLPVVANGRMLGALCIDPHPGIAPGTAWMERASALATALGVVLAKARAERAAAEAHAGFVRAQRMEGLARLAGGVAHDFNNLLAVVRTTVELMRVDGDPTSSGVADLCAIDDACARGVRLTRQLLQWSRGTALHAEEVDLGALALSMRPMLARLLGEDLHLEVEVGPEEAHVLADPSALEQVIMNLVVNARDAMPSGGPLAVRVSTVAEAIPPRGAASSGGGPYVCLEVEDAGHGMDAATRGRIFEPFFTTKDPERGTGLGLAVVDRVVREGGGWIEVDTAVGRGTTFTIWLPRIMGNGTPAPDVPAPAAELPPGLHVLLVEDDDALRASLARVLERAGCRVTGVATATEARAAPPPDALVTDVILPDGNGVDLAGELCAAQPDLPVVTMSGYLDDRVRLEQLRARGHMLVVKPFRPAELVERLAAMVRRRSGAPRSDR